MRQILSSQFPDRNGSGDANGVLLNKTAYPTPRGESNLAPHQFTKLTPARPGAIQNSLNLAWRGRAHFDLLLVPQTNPVAHTDLIHEDGGERRIGKPHSSQDRLSSPSSLTEPFADLHRQHARDAATQKHATRWHKPNRCAFTSDQPSPHGLLARFGQLAPSEPLPSTEATDQAASVKQLRQLTAPGSPVDSIELTGSLALDRYLCCEPTSLEFTIVIEKRTNFSIEPLWVTPSAKRSDRKRLSQNLIFDPFRRRPLRGFVKTSQAQRHIAHGGTTRTRSL